MPPIPIFDMFWSPPSAWRPLIPLRPVSAPGDPLKLLVAKPECEYIYDEECSWFIMFANPLIYGSEVWLKSWLGAWCYSFKGLIYLEGPCPEFWFFVIELFIWLYANWSDSFLELLKGWNPYLAFWFESFWYSREIASNAVGFAVCCITVAATCPILCELPADCSPPLRALGPEPPMWLPLVPLALFPLKKVPDDDRFVIVWAYGPGPADIGYWIWGWGFSTGLSTEVIILST